MWCKWRTMVVVVRNVLSNRNTHGKQKLFRRQLKCILYEGTPLKVRGLSRERFLPSRGGMFLPSLFRGGGSERKKVPRIWQTICLVSIFPVRLLFHKNFIRKKKERTGLMNVQPFAKEKVSTRTHRSFYHTILAFFYRVMINFAFILKTVAHFCNTFATRGVFQVTFSARFSTFAISQKYFMLAV